MSRRKQERSGTSNGRKEMDGVGPCRSSVLFGSREKWKEEEMRLRGLAHIFDRVFFFAGTLHTALCTLLSSPNGRLMCCCMACKGPPREEKNTLLSSFLLELVCVTFLWIWTGLGWTGLKCGAKAIGQLGQMTDLGLCVRGLLTRSCSSDWPLHRPHLVPPPPRSRVQQVIVAAFFCILSKSFLPDLIWLVQSRPFLSSSPPDLHHCDGFVARICFLFFFFLLFGQRVHSGPKVQCPLPTCSVFLIALLALSRETDTQQKQHLCSEKRTCSSFFSFARFSVAFYLFLLPFIPLSFTFSFSLPLFFFPHSSFCSKSSFSFFSLSFSLSFSPSLVWFFPGIHSTLPSLSPPSFITIHLHISLHFVSPFASPLVWSSPTNFFFFCSQRQEKKTRRD